MLHNALFNSNNRLASLRSTSKTFGSKSTICTEWIRAEKQPEGDLTLSHDFLGINLRVGGDNTLALRNSTVKLRVLNKAQYEPFLEENEKRVYDIIQVYPKEFCFNPAAEAWLRLPSCVSSEFSGQLVCLYSSNTLVRHGVRHLKWTAVDSECFQVNLVRTEARLICKKTGVYRLLSSPLTLNSPRSSGLYRPMTSQLATQPKLHVSFPTGCVTKCIDVTLKVLRIEELYNSPSVSPVPQTLRTRPRSGWLEPPSDSGTACDQLTSDCPDRSGEPRMDITCSPVVLVRPTRCRFTKPVQLTVPLLGCNFDDLFAKEESRLVVLKSRVLNEEELKWKHHYNTPEVIHGAGGEKVASFLLTRGGLYKVVRRLPEQHMRIVEHVTHHISRQLCSAVSSSYFVTTKLRGFMTGIAEPGKQFVLRIALFDASQTTNPDTCFVSEVCSQPLTIPIGKSRFLVRGNFEPDRDAADHSEERTVVFTGKTTFVDFYMKLRLNDPTKFPEVIGKVSVYGERNTQYYISLCKPSPIEQEQHFSKVKTSSPTLLAKRPKPLIKRQSMPVIRAAQVAIEQEASDIASPKDSKYRHLLPTLPIGSPGSSSQCSGSARRDYNRRNMWNSHVSSVSPDISYSEENWPTPNR